MIYNFDVKNWNSSEIHNFKIKIRQHSEYAKELLELIIDLQVEYYKKKANKALFNAQKKLMRSEREFWTVECISGIYFWGNQYDLYSKLTEESRKHYTEYSRVIENIAMVTRILKLLDDSKVEVIQLSQREYDIIKQYL